MNIMDLAKAVAPECKTEITGIRPGEKLHEVMVPEDDARNTAELDDRYLIKPTFQLFDHDPYEGLPICPEGFRSASDTNTRWPKEHDLAKMVAEIKLDEG
jgi:UDP-N-acetylglucosamine 4,6-dehydratase